MGAFTHSYRITWSGDGAGEDGPVQSATPPVFDVDVGASAVSITVMCSTSNWTGSFTLEDETLSFDGATNSAVSTTDLSFDSLSATVSDDLIDVVLADPGGAATTFYDNQSGFVTDQGLMVSADVGGSTIVVAVLPGHDGLSTYSHSGAGFAHLRDKNDSNQSTMDAPSALAMLDVGGTPYVFVASSTEPGVTCYEVRSSGNLSYADTLEPEDGLWVNGVTTLTPVYGTSFVIVGAAGSNSISVLEVDGNGDMSVASHVLDDRDTRFADIQTLEVLQDGNQTYVAAAGSDDGISLFVLLPNGQLVHLASIEDTIELGLTDVNAMALAVQEGKIHIAASSASEAGLTHLIYDTGGSDHVYGDAGNNSLIGSGNEDLIFDGDGIDAVTGDLGADTFVFAQDGQTDTITDFELGIDRIDVSGWTGLYSTLQISVTSTAAGAIVTFGDETLVIETSDGNQLSFDDFLETDILGIARIEPTTDTPPEVAVDLEGSDLSDTITGNVQDNHILGLDGGDVIFAGGGDDTSYGGNGSDTINGEFGNDRLYGDGAHDQLFGGDGNDYVYGGSGWDTLFGGDGDDTMSGDSSYDTLSGGDGQDHLTGGTGADILNGDAGHDTLLSNTGVDTIYGGAGDDWISSGNGADTAYGGDGNDFMIGRTGWDTFDGGAGHDTLYGSEGEDLLRGGSGDDFLSGGFGFDTLLGGEGDDSVYGNIGADRLEGNAGHDSLYGATGEDILSGGDGDDVLYGGAGRDVLEGGRGDDLLRGGTAEDEFIFDVGHGRDTISGLERLDKISLTSELTGGITDAADVFNEYARLQNGAYVLLFPTGDEIQLESDVTKVDLIGSIQVD